MPFAKIYVYDNNSTDQTAKIAASMDITARSETLQGKGYVYKAHVC